MPGYQNAFADSIIGRGKGVGVYFKNHAAIEVYQRELFKMIKFNPILHGGGSNRSPPIDYCTPILMECPEWTDFS